MLNSDECVHTRAIPKVSCLDILDSNIFHNLYISADLELRPQYARPRT